MPLLLEGPIKPVLFFLLIWILYHVASHLVDNGKKTDELDQESYARLRRYLDSLIFHTAYREGSVCQDRIFGLVPHCRQCELCSEQIQEAFEDALFKEELVLQDSGLMTISAHVRKLIENAEAFQDLGTAWVLPERKLWIPRATCCHQYIGR